MLSGVGTLSARASKSSGPVTPPGPTPVNWDVLDNVSNTAGVLQKTGGGDGFGSGNAYQSTEVPSGDFIFTWKTPTAQFDGVAVGFKLSSGGVPSSAGSYEQYDFAINVNDSRRFGASTQAIALGSFGGLTVSTAGDSELIIRRDANVVTMYADGVLIQTIIAAGTGPGRVGCNPYHQGGKDCLKDATLG